VLGIVSVCAAVVVIAALYLEHGISAGVEARRADKSARRWSLRRRRAKALRAADHEAQRAVEDALARAQVVRDRDRQ
jgi:hypothetical protein